VTDDIVTRLRDTAYETDVCWEAANEIERLRADHDRWQKLAKRLFDTHGHWAGDETWCPAYMCETSECDCGYEQIKADYEQAVRGD
jgi:hypothetical protein